MLSNQNKGSILLHVILLVNIVLIVGVVVFNNSFVVINNIDVGNNQEEVFANMYNKGNIAIDSVVKYNSNGGGFIDGIGCPADITMSGSTQKTSGMSSTLVYEYGTIHCLGIYQGNEFKIFYDEDLNDFRSVKYEGEVIEIQESSNTDIDTGGINLALNKPVTSSPEYQTHYKEKAVDGDLDTYFDTSSRKKTQFLKVDLGSEKQISTIIIRTPDGYTYGDWDNLDVKLYNNSNNLISEFSNINFPTSGVHEIDLLNYGLSNNIRYVELSVKRYYLFISELEIYELESGGSEEVWETSTNFTDDDTYFSFTSDGISGNTGIDDDLNSDNYSVTSYGSTYFPDDYQDDDVVPRLTVFGSIPNNNKYNNIYWNNYKTIEYLSGNLNNIDNLNVKMSDVDDAYMYVDTFNTTNQDYNLKILEFNRELYKNEFTLLPINTNDGDNITDFIGYIQKNPTTGELSLSKGVTGNEYVFNFKDKDYALFMQNNSEGTLSYHLSAETPTGEKVYINPIDDSGTGTISVLANHIIIGGEKNFIGENFEVVGAK